MKGGEALRSAPRSCAPRIGLRPRTRAYRKTESPTGGRLGPVARDQGRQRYHRRYQSLDIWVARRLASGPAASHAGDTATRRGGRLDGPLCCLAGRDKDLELAVVGWGTALRSWHEARMDANDEMQWGEGGQRKGEREVDDQEFATRLPAYHLALALGR